MPTDLLAWLIPLPPILAFFAIVLFAYRSNQLSHWLAVGGVAISWALAMTIFGRAVLNPGFAAEPIISSIGWLPAGNDTLAFGIQIDRLSILGLFFVSWTLLAIFVYSIGYHNFGHPADPQDVKGLPPKSGGIEPMYARFFAFISLFAFAMLTLVLADNLLLLFVGWEIMGLCSYLLIGFWYGKPSARDAMVKAFMTTRVGDVLMLLGIVYLYSATGSLSFHAILGSPETLEKLAATPSVIGGFSTAGLIGLLLFFGTVGKSAQFPLHVWLPDAMEGPTPVSALIHAATMVSAGVYLILRTFPLITAGWSEGMPLNPTMAVIAAVGAFTALFAATIAVAQDDIKRVLAYSTISQLGYMVAGVGIGAFVAAAFHLLTHAFFKALLFLGSGSVIHGVEHGSQATGEHLDANDMFNMGGLRRKMPLTFWTFLAGGLALSGFPLVTAGFWSKDELLGEAFGTGHPWVFGMLVAAAVLTAFYTMRQISLTFLGQPRTESAEHGHESPVSMTLPLVVLAVFAVGAGWIGISSTFPVLGGTVPNFLHQFMAAGLAEPTPEGVFHMTPFVASVLASLGGLLVGWLVYRNVPAGAPDPLAKWLGPVHTLLKRKYYFDELYQAAFVRPVYWLGETFSHHWLDQLLIDGVLNLVAQAARRIGSGLRNWIDLPVVNGFGDLVGDETKAAGRGLRFVQTGQVQQYLIMGLIFTGLLISYVLLTSP
jgi:NADH-quinone oxidoreductase subunit L